MRRATLPGTRYVVLAGLAALAAGRPPAAFAAPAEGPFTGEYHVVLEDALWHPETPDQRRPLTLRFECDEGRWQRHVTGHARRYNWGDHWGRLLESADGGALLRVRARMRIEPDPWVGGDGLADYTVTLRRRGPALAGTWEGALRGQACRGAAGGTVLVVRRPAGWTPPGPAEHPRLLLRKHQVAALRDKARTDWGRAMLARLAAEDPSRSGMAVGQGLLYVLTGDRAWADRARALLQEDIDSYKWFCTGAYHDPAVKAVEGCFAYDLIYDACDEAFRGRMNAMIGEKFAFLYRGADHFLFNPNDASNWSAMFRSGLGVCALALLTEAAPYPPEPQRPEVPHLEPPAGFQPGRGVPVVRLEAGRLWPDWLAAGPFRVESDADPLASIGGLAAARPESGTAVPYTPAGEPAATARCVFAPIDPKCVIDRAFAERIRKPEWEGAIELKIATGEARLSPSCFYTVLQNAAPGLYRIEWPFQKVRMARVFLAGRELARGDVVRLDAGRFPLMALAAPMVTGGFMGVEFYVRFAAVGEAEARDWLGRQAQHYQADLEDWRDGRQAWEQSGRLHPRAPYWLGVARTRIDNYILTLGEHGWNTEGEAYHQHACRLVLPFAHAYRHTRGKDLAPAPNLGRMFPLYVARTIVGPSAARMQAYGPGGGPLGLDNWARGFALVPDPYRRAALWTWNRTQALADAGRFKLPEAPVDHLDPMSAAFMFVNYPLDLPEQDPGEVLPKVTVEQERGGYVFRNRWQDDEDFVTTVFLDSHFPGGGWSSLEAADLRISGLGVDWTVRGMGWGNGSASKRATNLRQYQNVLLVPEVVRAGHEAVATFFEPRPDGSGTLSMDLGGVYAPPPRGSDPPAADTPKVAGMRALAVDYSGRSGAPALFAVVDQVRGTAGRNVWQLVTEKAHPVAVEGRTFTIRADGGATLRGTVVAPAAARVATEEVTLVHEINYHGGHKRAPFARTVLGVSGGEFFFIVMTVQPGDPPAVRVEGDGPGAAATVGRQVLRFDGKRIVVQAADPGAGP